MSFRKIQNSLKKAFNVGGLSVFSKSFSYLRTWVTKGDIIWFLCFSSILLVAVLIRILPLNWGFTLSEFDPYFQYDITNYVVEKGYLAWFETPKIEWTKYWYPWGRNIASTSFPGVPFTAAALYHLISALGISASVLDTCIMFPVVMAVLTCVVAYFFGKDIGGREVGLFFALFLALNPAFISRTSLGFFDTETIGIFSMLLAFLLYLRSLQPEKIRLEKLCYAIAGGLALGYFAASWGAARYLFGLIPLFTFVLLLFKKYSTDLLLSYSATIGVGLLLATAVPKLGLRYLTEPQNLAAFGVFLLLSLIEITQFYEDKKTKLTITALFFGALAVALFISVETGIISLPAERFLSILNPFLRGTMPLIESVQEHRPATWASIYFQFGLLIFLVPLGIYFASKKRTNHNLFLIVFTLTTIYFASSMIRLTLIMAPAFCALGALAVVELLNAFIDITKKRTFTRRRLRLAPHVGKGFSWAFFICLFLVTTLTLTKGIESANMPPTIASSSVPVRANLYDWEEALTWISESLPSDAVVASWWDYGYWITVGGNKSTLADNGTLNTTQIAQIGRMFMSNETAALAILEPLGVTHVVAFSTISLALSARQALFFGDEVKWYWMAKIGGLNVTDLQDTTVSSRLGFSGLYLPPVHAVLTKLMIYGALGAPDVSTLVDDYGLPQELRPAYFQLVFLSSNRMVSIYRVRYEIQPLEPV